MCVFGVCLVELPDGVQVDRVSKFLEGVLGPESDKRGVSSFDGAWVTMSSKEKEKYKRHKSERKAKEENNSRDERGEAARLRSEVKPVLVCEPGPEPEINTVAGLNRNQIRPRTCRRTRVSALSQPCASLRTAALAEAVAVAPAASSPTVLPPVIMSKLNSRFSRFVPVSTLCRAPISLPPEFDPAPPAGPPSSSNAIAIPAPVLMHDRRLAQNTRPLLSWN